MKRRVAIWMILLALLVRVPIGAAEDLQPAVTAPYAGTMPVRYANRLQKKLPIPLCGAETAETAETEKQSLSPIIFSAAHYPELFLEEDRLQYRKTVQDFAVTPDGTIVFLQSTGAILEYDFSGNRIGVYDLKIRSNLKLMTYMGDALRLLTGRDGRFYILGRYSAKVITVTRDTVVGVSAFPNRVRAIDANVSVCDTDGNIRAYMFDPTNRNSGWRCYRLDTTAPELTYTDPRPGRPLNDGYTYEAHFPDGTAFDARNRQVTLYKDGVEAFSFLVSNTRAEKVRETMPFVYGVFDGKVLLRITEGYEDPSSVAECTENTIYTTIDLEELSSLENGAECAYTVCDALWNGENTQIRCYGDKAYCLRRNTRDNTYTLAEVADTITEIGPRENLPYRITILK